MRMEKFQLVLLATWFVAFISSIHFKGINFAFKHSHIQISHTIPFVIFFPFDFVFILVGSQESLETGA